MVTVMTDKSGLKAAKEKGITLGEIGQRIVFENEHVRIWEVNLDPGETIDFHLHYHPYMIISLGGGKNEIETIFGDKRMSNEPLGSTVFMSSSSESVKTGSGVFASRQRPCSRAFSRIPMMISG